MTLSTLLLYIGIAALILTILVGVVMKGHKNWLMTFLQNFCGALFVFSGWVKAVDPLGTAYKMEQYFAEFEATFSDTWFSFLAPLFPALSEQSILFSVVMIVFEIVLGLMLLMGTRTKLTSWAFLLLVGFFTFLTGFTYLTGYVPGDVNFFEFGKWGPYVETNMKVTDCGCFGDFIKLKPKISFFKDVFLLLPALFFVFRHKDMHQLFGKGGRTLIIAFSTIGLLIYCMSNYVWDIPGNDFRPFKVGENIKIKKAMESAAESNVPVIAYKLTNKSSGQIVEIPFAQYLKEFKNYPKAEWGAEQIRGEPILKIVKIKDENGKEQLSILDFYEEIPAAELTEYLQSKYDIQGDTTEILIESSKISDFEISDIDGNPVTSDILNDPNYSFMIVSYKLPEAGMTTGSKMVYDTIFRIDTIRINADSFIVNKEVENYKGRREPTEMYDFPDDFVERYTNVINPVLDSAEVHGHQVYAITAYSDPARIDDFRHATQSAYPFYTADDILLKTIVRSNPGVVLLKSGRVIKKWHYKKLPSFNEIQATFMKE